MQVEKYLTKNYKQTQKLGKDFAKEILKKGPQNSAVVLALSGNLGGGKTTFLQGFAKGLGVKEKILSPTFVILKHFKITKSQFTDFYHIDCYRLKDEKPARNASHSDAGGDILGLGLEEILANPENIVAIEWPEKIKKVLPKNLIKIGFKFIDKTKREISFKNL